jgi:hypothetical protein
MGMLAQASAGRSQKGYLVEEVECKRRVEVKEEV